MTTNAALHDLCLIANALIVARATVYAAQGESTKAVSTLWQIDPQTIAADAAAIYKALSAKAPPQVQPSTSTSNAI
jgi:hypothetical protein